MAKKDNDFLKKLQATFALEADEHFKAVSTGLLELERAPAIAKQKAIIEGIFREVHSLKGASRAVNRLDVESICQPFESMLAALNRGEIALSPELFDLFHLTVRGLERLLSSPGAERTADNQSLVELLVQRLEKALSGYRDRRSGIRDQGSGGDQSYMPIPDPRSLATGTVRVSTSKLDALFRLVEEMIFAKLAAEQHVIDLHEIAAVLESREKASEKVRAHLLAFQSVLERGKLESRRGAVDITKWVDALDEEDTVARTLVNKIGTLTAATASDCRALGKMVDNLLDEVKKLLMLPLSSLFEILPRIVRDLTRDQGKEVDLVIQGAGIEIDRRVQEEMKDPLIHLVRNCVDHGIETPADRISKNKPARGQITVNVSQKGTAKAEIVISDDGKGIDLSNVLLTAQKLGIVSPDEATQLNEQETASLIFLSGVSTSPIVTDISGRGLGLAIVREKIEKLGGSITLESRTGTGTTFRITLPVTLAAFRGVLVRVADQLCVLPTINVERVTRTRAGSIKTVENREALQMNGSTLSVMRLADVLGLRRTRAGKKADDLEQVVVLASGGERIAFIVDEILNEQEILLKGLGSQLVRLHNIAGSTVLGSGALVPFLNVSDLMKSGIEPVVPVEKEIGEQAVEERKKSVLVVEDSITARALLKNILEAAGFNVKTSVDGVDALTNLKTEPFDLVVSDVDMPRMDGFNLTMRIRSDKKLAELPVVLVTALDSRENRERGIDAGANAYIVKSSFDQAGLLEVIKRLI